MFHNWKLLFGVFAALAAIIACASYESQHRFHRWLVSVLSLCYLAVALVISVCVIVNAWPGNRFESRRYTEVIKPRVMLEVTRESLRTVEGARTAIERAQSRPEFPVLIADRELILQAAAHGADFFSNRWSRFTLQAGRLPVFTVVTNTLAQLETLHSNLLSRAAQIERLPPPHPARRQQMDNAITIPFTAAENRAMDELSDITLKTEGAFFLGSKEIELLSVLCAFGAFGACVQGLASVGVYLGKQEFRSSWGIYYLSRPVVGAGVAAAFYLVLRAGIFVPTAQIDLSNTFGACAIAIIVGLFSSQAMEKLKRVAGSLFESSEHEAARSPRVDRVVRDPASPTLLRIEGTNFSPETVVFFNNATVDQRNVFFKRCNLLHVAEFLLPADSKEVRVRVAQIESRLISNEYLYKLEPKPPVEPPAEQG